MIIPWSAKEKHYTSDVHRVRTGRGRIAPSKPPKYPAVFAKEKTEGVKLGPVSATYVTQKSCPMDCPFMSGGCYAEHGPLAMLTTKRLNRQTAENITRIDIARQEAAAIDELSGQRDLRLHVVGDSTTVEGTRILAAAARRYIDRGGKRVWTYTHAWRDVPRGAWGAISVLASCETEADVLDAQSRGYATAAAIDCHNTDKLHADGPLNILPCPEQTKGVTCQACRICTDDTRLIQRSITIAFALHGDNAGMSKARRSLTERRIDGVR